MSSEGASTQPESRCPSRSDQCFDGSVGRVRTSHPCLCEAVPFVALVGLPSKFVSLESFLSEIIFEALNHVG